MAGPLARTSGAVSFVYSLVVDERGRVVDAVLVRSTGRGELDVAARKVFDVMRFTPARRGGRAVRVRFEMPLDLKPSGSP
jgi:TonB family protein